MSQAVIVDAVRTPVGRAFKGSLASLRPDETLAFIIDALLERNPGVDPASVEEVVAGCGLPQGLQANNIARIAVLLSEKLGQETNGVTVSGAGRLSLSAPTTGASAGFVIVQTPTSTAPLSVSGSGVASLRGVVDLPSAAVTVSGASTLTTLATASGYGRLIARSLTVSGSSSVVVDVTPPQGPGGNFQRAAIASGPVLASRSVPAGHAMMVDTSSRGGTSQGSRNKARGATPSGSVLSRVSLVKRGATGQAKKVRPASSKPASGASEMIAIPTDLVADVFHVKGRSRRG